MTRVRVSGVKDFRELGARWRDFEQRAAGSFFQSWSWVGCLAEERFPDPVLVEVTESGRVVAFALFNRVRRFARAPVLHLGASGTAELDCPYVEQNGPLAEAGREGELTEQCLRAVSSSYDLVLPGVGETVLAAVRHRSRLLLEEQSQASPFIDLADLRSGGHDYLGTRSANTRQQIRRSDRFYERGGPIAVHPAQSVEAAHAMLDELAALHRAAWTSRGQPGSFVRPFFRRFHQALIATAMQRGEIALLKVSNNDRTIGILYNFVYQGKILGERTLGGQMLAYQTGLAYRTGEQQAKPGLTCHYQAIRMALQQGLATYDFLAGDDRYKRSLANRDHTLTWARTGALWSPRLLFRLGIKAFR